MVTELQILTLALDAEKPEVDVSGGKMMLVKVEACSLSAGDVIMLSGAVDKVRTRVNHATQYIEIVVVVVILCCKFRALPKHR